MSKGNRYTLKYEIFLGGHREMLNMALKPTVDFSSAIRSDAEKNDSCL